GGHERPAAAGPADGVPAILPARPPYLGHARASDRAARRGYLEIRAAPCPRGSQAKNMNAPIKRAGVIVGIIAAVIAAFFAVSIVAPSAAKAQSGTQIGRASCRERVLPA